jgi:hypothetical protein
MRAWYQSVASAQSQANSFVNGLIGMSLVENAAANNTAAGGDMEGATLTEAFAIIDIGEAQHTVADSTSPPHAGFQPWYGISDGIAILGPAGYAVFVELHHLRESPAVYVSQGDRPANTVAARMHEHLLDALNQ